VIGGAGNPSGLGPRPVHRTNKRRERRLRLGKDQRITTALNLEQRRVAERSYELRRRNNTALAATGARFAAAGHGPGSGTISVVRLRLDGKRLRESMRAASEVFFASRGSRVSNPAVSKTRKVLPHHIILAPRLN
jgi:hypothetical protein